MSTSYVMTAYAAVALAFWMHAAQMMLLRARSRRRERLFALEERLLLAAVALAASLAWPLLLPVQLIARAEAVYVRRGRHAWRERGHWRRPMAVLGRAG
ncbi:MAG: hypothetical protein KY464_07640 [Gemmatimonadetes bacterium]|nr:hypothetical protein [Gemmatimonadota bacterium]